MAVRQTMRRTVAVVACLPARVSDRSQWQPTAPVYVTDMDDNKLYAVTL